MNWMVIVGFGALATGLATATVAQDEVTSPSSQTIPIGSEELVRSADETRNFVAADAFDAPDPLDFNGRSFRIVMPIQGQDESMCDGLPSWRYNAAEQKLQITYFGGFRLGFRLATRRGQPTALSERTMIKTVPVRCSQTTHGSYVATNAFGASTRITRRREIATEIAVKTANGSVPTSLLVKDIDMSPDTAREATKELFIRIEGTLDNFREGTSLICGIDKSEPKMTSAYDTTTDTCIYSGVLSTVTVYNRKSGETLIEKTFD